MVMRVIHRNLTLAALAVLGLQACETHLPSSQVVCWTDTASGAFHVPASGLHRYTSAYPDLVCVPLVTRRLSPDLGGGSGQGVAGPGGGSATPPPRAREATRLSDTHGTIVDRDRNLEVSVVESAVNPGTSLVAMETDRSFPDAGQMLNDLFGQHGLSRTTE